MVMLILNDDDANLQPRIQQIKSYLSTNIVIIIIIIIFIIIIITITITIIIVIIIIMQRVRFCYLRSMQSCCGHGLNVLP